jgi:hypothetical protein
MQMMNSYLSFIMIINKLDEEKKLNNNMNHCFDYFLANYYLLSI